MLYVEKPIFHKAVWSYLIGDLPFSIAKCNAYPMCRAVAKAGMVFAPPNR